MDAESKKQIIAEKLQKMEEERQEKLEKAAKQKENESNASENVENFIKRIDIALAEVQEKLDNFQPPPEDQKLKIQENFDEMTASVQKVQKFLTDSTYFLPSYMIERYHSKIKNLQQNVQEKREAVIPKKKFAFKSKKKTATVATAAIPKSSDSKSEVDGKAPTASHAADYECGFSDRKGEKLMLQPDECTFKDLALGRLEKCEVRIFGSPGAVHVNDSTECIVLCGPCSGSIFVDNCKDCTFVFACQQLRIHTTMKSKFFIHVTSKAVVEDCSEVTFAPYALTYADLEMHYEQSKLNRDINNWDKVDDFNWLAHDQASPHWAIMKEPDSSVKFT